MATYNNKLKVSNELDHSSIDLSCQTITSTDFNVVKPIYVNELVPGDTISRFTAESVVRLQPLATPTFGRVDLRIRSFFVPYRLIFPQFNDFYFQRPTLVNGTSRVYETVPNVSLKLLNDLIFGINSRNQYWDKYGWLPIFSESPSGSSAYDFQRTDPSDPSKKTNYLFDEVGKRLYDLFISLGYQIDLNCNDNVTKVSLLPIYAWIRLFYDWYLPSQYADLFSNAKNPSDMTTTEALVMCCHFLYIYYNDDVFSSASIQPFSPNGLESVQDISNITDYNGDHFDIMSDADGGSVVLDNMYTSNVLLGVRMMQYFQRHNLLTHRVNDLFKAKFGISSNAVRDDVTEYLGMSSQPVQISDVMATGENVGDYAGRGIASDTTNFNYKSEEFGLFIVVSEIVPRYAYAHTLKPHTTRLKPYDFFTPEFDGLATEPVTRYHVDYPFNQVDNFDSSQSLIFGFLPRYALGYKSSLDNLSGDFRVHSKNEGLDAFHLMRTFTYQDGSYYFYGNDRAFRYGGYHSTNFDRIFVDTNALNDHFLCIHAFDVIINRPMLDMSESWMLNSENNESRGQLVERGGSLS